MEWERKKKISLKPFKYLVVCTSHVISYVRLMTAKVFERAQDGCRLVKPVEVELLPSDTFWSHLNVIVLRENVGGAIRVFLNRLWAQWDRAQRDTTYKHTQRNKTSAGDSTYISGHDNKSSYQVFCVSVWTLSCTSLWTFQCSEINLDI